jgi:hypothetical protein
VRELEQKDICLCLDVSGNPCLRDHTLQPSRIEEFREIVACSELSDEKHLGIVQSVNMDRELQ